MSEIWIGLDLGTQSARALAVSATGAIVGRGTRPLTSRRDGARHEQDPEQWWTALAAACRDAVAELDRSAIGGAALCGTSGTILLVDPSGAALTPGLMYDDGRAVEQARRVNEAGAEHWATLGYRMQASWALPKLLWLLRERGTDLGRARVAHQVDFITRRLAGREVATDTSNALKTGYDLIADSWPDDLLEALGVPREIMPDVVLSGAPLGTVSAGAAAATGLPAGTPIIAGMTDGCAAQLGAGALEVGSWNSVLGTTLVLKGVSEQPIRDPAGVVYSHRAPHGGWLPGGASSVGAGVLTARFPGRDLDELSRRAAERAPSPLLAYPLVSRGERFPFSAPDAEGFVIGEPADEVDLYAALLQGVAFAERLCFDYLDLLGAPTDGALSLTGGATRSRHWCQLRADILGRPVRLPESAEAALGMAILAAAPRRGVPAAAAEMVRVREVIEPRPAERLQLSYLRLVDELERRGWLEPRVAARARERSIR